MLFKIARWFSGSLHLLNAHRPLADLPRLTPLLRRELKLPPSVTSPLGLEMPLYDVRLFRLACLVQIVGFCWLCGYSFTVYAVDMSARAIAAYVIPLTVISVGVDLYASIRHITQLHQTHRRETWDALRMAMVNDQEFVRSFEAIGVVKAWSALQLDLTLRAIPAVVIIFASIVGVLIGVGSLIGIILTWLGEALQIGAPNMRPPDAFEFLVTTFSALVLLRCGTVFIGDPVLRFRLNVALSVLCATAIRDTSTAIAISVAGIVGLRLLHGIGIGILYNLTQEIRLGRYPANLSESVSAILYLGWLVLLTAFLVPVTCNLFVVLRRGCERLTLGTLQSGD